MVKRSMMMDKEGISLYSKNFFLCLYINFRYIPNQSYIICFFVMRLGYVEVLLYYLRNENKY